MKKIFALVACLSLVASLAIGGSIAYLQDQDSAVNVMTLGNVHIKNHEYERVQNADGTYKTDTIDNQTSYVLQGFTQAKPLLPIVGDPSKSGDSPVYAGWDSTTVRMSQVDSYGGMQVFAGKNAQDKFVTVENTGKSDAYIRTFVALEVGDADSELIGSSYHSTWTENQLGTIEVDGNNYYVYEYVYNGGELSDGSWRHKGGLLPAGDTSYPSLSQIYLKSEATNEDVEAIDGNKNGMLDILVLSQAVQAAGFDSATAAFDAAFPKGEGNAKVAEWFGALEIPVQASTPDELKTILKNAKDGKDLHIILSDDFKTDSSHIERTNFGSSAQAVFNVNAGNVTIDFNGKTLDVDTTGGTNVFSVFMVTGNANLTVKGTGKLNYNTYGRSGGSAAFTCFGANSVITLDGDIDVQIVGDGSSLQMIYAHGATQDLGKIYVNAGNYLGKTTTSFTNPFYAQGGGSNSILVSGGTFKVYANYNADKMTAIDKYMTIADGYTYTASEKDSEGFVTYTVIPE